MRSNIGPEIRDWLILRAFLVRGHRLCGVGKITAAARIHCGDKLKSAPDSVRAHWHAPPRLRRFPSAGAANPAPHAGIRALVEKQHAQMRQADLSGFHPQPAADQRGHRGGMMWRTKRPGAAKSRRRGVRPPATAPSISPAPRARRAAAASREDAAPASICRRRADRSSAYYGRRRRRSRWRVWRSPVPSHPSDRECWPCRRRAWPWEGSRPARPSYD